MQDDEKIFDRRSRESWHVGKEIPLAMLVAVLIQTGAAIWWAASFSATVTSKLDELSLQVAALTADKYTQNDAKRDQALLYQKSEMIERRVEKMEYNIYGGRKWQR